ncbi:hypothetical protein K08M3_50060 [Vibrio alginolyticus]|uniref:Uncharacterized protein n=1 Tax=Vibrio alginolyticus TaxID=663 RepID=A0A1W6TLC9_VIBAL|nr:hypothetical protein K04M1_49930 [Vibrio alginolyticus]ARP11621.1 hypothetical protein K04M3_50520 [Vibrio alginolyticus]ARP16702.1 hypothetical protein K04M5_50500 [Vibrio alginolyticus]ARP21721.1 hypothetical protein K05K4_50120 [Vibrio alginolyticus]ARP26802.1 hypothetical protein K06K5_50020 [Vibrio alginolyticus]
MDLLEIAIDENHTSLSNIRLKSPHKIETKQLNVISD